MHIRRNRDFSNTCAKGRGDRLRAVDVYQQEDDHMRTGTVRTGEESWLKKVGVGGGNEGMRWGVRKAGGGGEGMGGTGETWVRQAGSVNLGWGRGGGWGVGEG